MESSLIPGETLFTPVDAATINSPFRVLNLPEPVTGIAYTVQPSVTFVKDLPVTALTIDDGAYTAIKGLNSLGSRTYQLTLTQTNVYDIVMVYMATSLLLSPHIDYVWLFEITRGATTLYWSTQSVTVESQLYDPKIDPKSFTGIKIASSYSGNERIHVAEDITLEVPDFNNEYASSDFIGNAVKISLWASDGTTDGSGDAVQRVFNFKIKSCRKIYDILKFTLEDAICEVLDSLYPETEIISNIWASDRDKYTNACFPVPFGTAYIPLPSVYISADAKRYYVLGDIPSGVTYAITQVQSPQEWPKSVWASTSYSFNQATKDTYRVFEAIIADSDGDNTADANGLFPEGDTFLPISTKFTKSNTASIDSPEEIINMILTGTGITLDTTGYTQIPTMYGAFREKKERAIWISEILKSSHAVMRIKANGDREIKNLVASPVVLLDETEIVDAEKIKTGTFEYNPTITKEHYDGGYIQVHKSGEPQHILYKYKVGLGNNVSTSPSDTTLNLQFITDSTIAQKIGTLYFERKLEQEATLSFIGRSDPFCLNPDDIIAIAGQDYEAPEGYEYEVVITAVDIQENLLTKIYCEKFSHALSEYADLTHSALTIDVDSSDPTWNYVIVEPDGSITIDKIAATIAEIEDADVLRLGLTGLSADPADPDDGKAVLWLADGTGAGNAGDLMIKVTLGATTTTSTISKT